MNNSYRELIEQTYTFPQNGFDINNDFLTFNGVDLHRLINKYGTPFRLTYLPKIRQQIQKARILFNDAMKTHNYQGKYEFCYCTKCCHFSHVITTALKEHVSLETSSSFDIDLIERLYQNNHISKDITIIHNGYKTDGYLKNIAKLSQLGFKNSITILDNVDEIDRLESLGLTSRIKIGLRLSVEEKPGADYYTSRLGINRDKVLPLVNDRLLDHPLLDLVMVHFFVDSGINDTLYYWDEFKKSINIYTQVKSLCNSVTILNIGGGFPIQNSLGFDYDYESITNQIVRTIKSTCLEASVNEPDIFTEFGKYTVGESGAVIFEVLHQKEQNDSESWYIIDNSLMNTIPDAWSINEKFILLPLNKWQNPYHRVNIGGISCDQHDYYNSEQLNQQILLPSSDDNLVNPLYLGFFHTGAYQDAISGYGGIKHCLIPAPKQIIIDVDEQGNMMDHVYRDEQNVEHMLNILGYDDE